MPSQNRCSPEHRETKPANLEFPDFDHSVKLGVPAGKGGEVIFYLPISYRGPPQPPKVNYVRLHLPFHCNSKGDLQLKSGSFERVHDQDLSVDLQLYQKRGPLADLSLPGIPASEWKEWMKQLNFLKIVLIANLTMTKGQGGASVNVNPESVDIPSGIASGSTGDRTAVLGPMTIELEPVEVAPPITTRQGLIYYVYFDVNSSELDKVVVAPPDPPKHQGNALVAWLRESFTSQWDVMAALLWGKLAVRAEARASATGEGLSPAELLSYNQELSRKRLDAVLDRLKKTIAEKDPHIVLDATQMKAIGASQAPKFGVEDVNERRCVIDIDVKDLEKSIKELYSREFGGTSTSSFMRRTGLIRP